MDLQAQADALFARARQSGSQPLGVAVARRGDVEYVAWVYRVRHDAAPSEWWVVEVLDNRVTAIKRICEY